MDGPKATVSVDIDKELLLKFKSMCVLKETTMSEEVESLVKDWVTKNEGSLPKTQKSPEKPAEQKPGEQAQKPMQPLGSPSPASTEPQKPPSENEKAYL